MPVSCRRKQAPDPVGILLATHRRPTLHERHAHSTGDVAETTAQIAAFSFSPRPAAMAPVQPQPPMAHAS
jgi:hypothetical protein